LPEGENFCLCDNCHEIIDRSIIWTQQEIDYWLKERDNSEYSIRDYYELSCILHKDFGARKEYSKEICEIAMKIIKD
jgi:hypothetical protein